MRACVVAVLLLAIAGASAIALAQPAAPELRVDAPAELMPVAKRIARVDQGRVLAVMRLAGISEPGAPVRVVLASEQSELGRSTPPWIAGFAGGESDTIVLFPSRSISYPNDSLEELLQHEMAHILIARAARGAAVPRWFHEGLALIAERTWGLEDRSRVAFAMTQQRVTIAALDADFQRGPDRAARAYAISGAAVRDIMNRYGAAAPSRILARLAAGDDFETAFRAATGATLGEAERLFWRDSWWYQAVPLLTSSLVLWLGVTLLAIYAIRSKRRRGAEMRRKWAEEEVSDQPDQPDQADRPS